MKVVLFCGGLGLRLRGSGESIPKPLTPIGNRPIIWHLMRYYAHFGHKDFILCLGHRAFDFKDYFFNHGIDDWNITFAETGLGSNIGERLQAVRPYLQDSEVFFANYADGLSDLPLDRYLDDFVRLDRLACLLSVPPHADFHIVEADRQSRVRGIRTLRDRELRINGGFFVFHRRIFEFIKPGEELVEEPFVRLAAKGQLTAYPYDGFWQCMDTLKDRMALEELASRDPAPWEVWKAR